MPPSADNVQQPVTATGIIQLDDKILTLIFSMLVEEDKRFITRLPLHERDIKINLSQVCGRFRSLITGNPIFWRAFHVSPDASKATEALLNLASVLIARCKSPILALQIMYPLKRRSTLSGASSLDPITDIIWPFRAKLANLSLCLKSDFDAWKFLNLEHSSFPHLSCLFLTILNTVTLGSTHTYSYFGSNLKRSFYNLSELPKLKQFAFIAFNGGSISSLRGIRWDTLTHLCLETASLDYQECLKILRQCKHLTNARLRINVRPKGKNDANITLSPIKPFRDMHTLIRVISLETPSNDERLFGPVFVRRRDGRPGGRYKPLMSFPKLRDLTFAINDRNAGWSLPSLVTFIRTSMIASNLRIIRLQDLKPLTPTTQDPNQRRHQRYMTLTDITTFFGLIERVEELHLPMLIPLSPAILGNIATGSLLPHLQVLKAATLHPIDAIVMIPMRNASHRRGLAKQFQSTRNIMPSSLVSLTLTVPSDLQDQITDFQGILPKPGQIGKTAIEFNYAKRESFSQTCTVRRPRKG